VNSRSLGVGTSKPKHRLKNVVPLASTCHMDCAEYQELEQAYAAAVRRWSQHASSQTTVIPGTDQTQRATALVERNFAANALHLHRHQCLVCKRQGAA
jgi:hypothetical protein